MAEAAYQGLIVAPDRRLIRALELFAAYKGQPSKADVQFVTEGWQVRIGQDDWGRLSRYPSPSEIGAMIKRVFGQPNTTPVAGQASSFQTEIDSFEPGNLVAALLKIDERVATSGIDAAAALDAARIMSRLAVQQVDFMEFDTDVAASALALTLLAEAYGLPVGHERCLATLSLGYLTEARACAATLSEADPLKAYLTGDEQRLSVIGMGGNSTAEGRYLRLLQLAEQGDRHRWEGAVKLSSIDRKSLLAAVKTAEKFDKFEWNPALGLALLELAVQETNGLVPSGAKPWQSMVAFRADKASGPLRRLLGWGPRTFAILHERNREWLTSSTAGPLGAPQLAAAFFHSAFLSGVTLVGQHVLVKKSKIDDVEKFMRWFGQLPFTPLDSYTKSIGDLLAAKKGAADPAALIADVVGGRLSSDFSQRVLQELTSRIYGTKPGIWRAAVRGWMKSIDSRPSSLLRAALVTKGYLFDAALTIELAEAGLNHGPQNDPEAAIRLAAWLQDEPRLRAYLTDPAFTVHSFQVLEALAETSSSDEEADKPYRVLVNAHPREWKYTSAFADRLAKQGRTTEARDLLRRWLDEHSRQDGLEYVNASRRLADLYARDGMLEEGLPHAMAVVESEQARAMETAAGILDRLGRTAEAESIYRRTVTRYPDVARSTVLLAQFFWRQGRTDEALGVLAQWRKGGSPEDFQRELAGRIEETAARSITEATAELRAYAVAFPQDAVKIIETVGERHPQIAFEIFSQTLVSGIAGNSAVIPAAHYLARWKGAGEANQWLAQLNRAMPEQAAVYAVQYDAYELLWLLFPHPEKLRNAEIIWLGRAISALSMVGDDPRRDQLAAYYSIPSVDRYRQIGRFILGLESETILWPLADTASHRCEIAFYRGVFAERQGRLTEANAWYRAAMETDSAADAEYHWARNRMAQWAKAPHVPFRN